MSQISARKPACSVSPSVCVTSSFDLITCVSSLLIASIIHPSLRPLILSCWLSKGRVGLTEPLMGSLTGGTGSRCVNAPQQHHNPHTEQWEVLSVERNKGRAAPLFHVLTQMELGEGDMSELRKHRHLCAAVCVCVCALVGLCGYPCVSTHAREGDVQALLKGYTASWERWVLNHC